MIMLKIKLENCIIFEFKPICAKQLNDCIVLFLFEYVHVLLDYSQYSNR